MSFSIEKFISDVNALGRKNLEIEIKLLIDNRQDINIYPAPKMFNGATTETMARALIEKYQLNEISPGKSSTKNNSVEISINFIAKQGIKKVIYAHDAQLATEYYQKNNLNNALYFVSNAGISYKFKVANEKPIDEINMADVQMIRIKYRYSIIFGKWRLDITPTKTIKSVRNISEVRRCKKNMFENPFEFADLIEFECEYISDQKLSLDDLIYIDNEIINKYFVAAPTNVPNTNLPNTNLPIEYQNILYELAKYIKPSYAEKFRGDWGFKKLGNQVVELNKNILYHEIIPEITKYYLTDKIDGKRTIIFGHLGKIFAVSDSVEIVADANFSVIADSEAYRTEQGEIYYYIFDVMLYDGENLTMLPFGERLKYFEKAAQKLNEFAEGKFRLKPFLKVGPDYHKTFRALFDKNIDCKSGDKNIDCKSGDYETDGFILTPENENYSVMRVYKIKPTEKLTIDFLIKKCPGALLGIKPYSGKNLYILHCGIDRTMYKNLGLTLDKKFELPPGTYVPVPFMTCNYKYSYLYWSNEELDGLIGEFRLDMIHIKKFDLREIDKCIYGQKNIWELIKIRTDRQIEVARGNYFGNDYRIAENLWWAYQNPIEIKDLMGEGKDEKITNIADYFRVQDSQLHKAQRSFNSFVKSKIIEQYRNTEWAIDLAAGKGQDLFRYLGAEYKNLVTVDIDGMALQELMRRKYDLVMENLRKRHPRGHVANTAIDSTLRLFTFQMNLNNNYKKNIEIFDKSHQNLPASYDLVVCNFAFHYFIEKKKNVMNIVNLINKLLKPGGRFIMCCFDGERVLQLLNENEGNWTVKKDGQIKYSIKCAELEKLSDFGHKIQVLLPFSGADYYTEYLVNINYLEEQFIKHNMILETNESFAAWIPKYFNKLYPLDIDDQKFVSLYHYYGFYKASK